MIVFLTLCYCGVLALLVKFGIVKLTLWWKLSPGVWMLLLFIAFFIPMQWGAPSGTVNVYQTVVEVLPNVSGEVVEVPIKGLEPLEQGTPLFRIDPTPYQAAVDSLKARLEDAKQSVERLRASADAAHATVAKTESDIDLAKANQLSAQASVQSADAALRESIGEKEKADIMVIDMQNQLAAAKREYDRLVTLLPQKAATPSEVDRAEIAATGIKVQLDAAEADARIAEETVTRSRADLALAEANAQVVDLELEQLVNAELPRVQALAREADLAANSMIGDEHTIVAAVRAELVKAEYDLQETVIRAPSDGYVVGMTLRPGQRVAQFPVRSWMSFVTEENTTLGVGIPQYALRHVRAGQEAEVTLKLFPGRVFAATVDEIVLITSEGQLQPSGTIMAPPGQDQQNLPFSVRLRLADDADIELHKLPGGSVGTACIYTDKARTSHIIRRVMIRMEAWKNYVIPF